MNSGISQNLRQKIPGSRASVYPGIKKSQDEFFQKIPGARLIENSGILAFLIPLFIYLGSVAITDCFYFVKVWKSWLLSWDFGPDRIKEEMFTGSFATICIYWELWSAVGNATNQIIHTMIVEITISLVESTWIFAGTTIPYVITNWK